MSRYVLRTIIMLSSGKEEVGVGLKAWREAGLGVDEGRVHQVRVGVGGAAKNCAANL